MNDVLWVLAVLLLRSVWSGFCVRRETAEYYRKHPEELWR